MKIHHVVWAIAAVIGSWVAGYIAAYSYDGLGVIAGVLTGTMVAAGSAILMAALLTVDEFLVERAQRPAPKHGSTK